MDDKLRFRDKLWLTYAGKWQALYEFSLKIRAVKCFFVGHDERSGEKMNYDPDYCGRCFCAWPQDKRELKKYLSRIYGWFVERNWRWFEKLDDWLLNHFNMPNWWEY